MSSSLSGLFFFFNLGRWFIQNSWILLVFFRSRAGMGEWAWVGIGKVFLTEIDSMGTQNKNLKKAQMKMFT